MASIDRIKYDGPANGQPWLVHKYSSDDFLVGGQLIVNQSQEALFFKGGEVLNVFKAGTYTLSTGHTPLLRNLLKIPGRKATFTAEIFFINKTTRLDMKWGTSVPFQVMDPKQSMMLTVRAFGQYGITVSDSRLFVTKMIGAVHRGHVLDHNTVMSLFNGLINVKVKEVISKCIIRRGVSLLDINLLIGEISDECRYEVNDVFSRYGIEVGTFYVESINFPDDEVDRFKDALKQKRVLETLGEDYYRHRSQDIMEKRENASIRTSGYRNSFIQENLIHCLGCKEMNSPQSMYCSFCGGTLRTLNFCRVCDEHIPANSNFCGKCGTYVGI